MGMSFATALAADFQGKKLLQDLEYEQAQTDNVKQETQYKKMQGLAMQKKAEGEQQVASWMQANMTADAAPGAAAEDTTRKMQQGATEMLKKGNFEGAKVMSDLAKKELDRAKDLRVEQEASQQQRKEALSSASVDYLQAPTPENTKQLAQAAMDAGVNPVTIPPPGTMQFSAWAKSQQTAALTGKEKLTYLEKAREFDVEQERRNAEFDQRTQDRADARAQSAAFQSASLDMRREGMELRKILAEGAVADRKDRRETAKDRADFKETTKLVDQIQKEAKPYFQDRSITQAIKGHLSDGSSVDDKQINQLLTSMKSGVGRATNLYYKDNKNFGDVAEKIAGFTSATFTGRYSDEQRKQIYEMADKMERSVIDPALRNLENDAKKKAKLYNLDPEPVSLSGEFNRTIEGRKTDRSATGAIGETIGKTPQPGAPRTYSEGTIARGGPGKPDLIFRNGKWEAR
jgi:hypothetical protein